MNAFDFLAEWEFYSGITLGPEQRILFIKQCKRVLYIEDAVLRDALRVARKHKDFGIDHIESVAIELSRRVRSHTAPSLGTKSWSSTTMSGLGGWSGLFDGAESRDRRRKREDR